MKKLVNRIVGIITLPAAIFWVIIYRILKNAKELEFYSGLLLFILNTIKTGRYEAPKAPSRIYP